MQQKRSIGHRGALAALCALAVAMAAGCITQGTETTAQPGTTASRGSIFPSGIDTVPNRPPLLVERPEEVRDVKASDLPVPLRLNLDLLGLTDDEGKCINTALEDYLNGPGAVATVDDERTVAALGGSIIVCTDQLRLAQKIATLVRADNPSFSDEQTDCVQEEVEVADPAALALFLGAFTYNGPGMERLQMQFAASFTVACGLP